MRYKHPTQTHRPKTKKALFSAMLFSGLLSGPTALPKLALAQPAPLPTNPSTTANTTNTAVNGPILQQDSERERQERQERLDKILRPEPDARPASSTESENREKNTPSITISTLATDKLAQNESPCFPIQNITLSTHDSAPAAAALPEPYPNQDNPFSAATQNAPATGPRMDNDFTWALAAIHKSKDGQVDSPIGACLGTQGVEQTMARIQNAIIAQGYTTTRVLAIPQNLKTGQLQFAVIPGRIAAIRTGEKTSPFDASRLNLSNALPTQSGAILNLRHIEQALENLKRPPSAEADIQIAPASADGAAAPSGATNPTGPQNSSDLIINYNQSQPFRIHFGLDDSGSRSTGKYTLSTSLSYDTPFALNDTFSFTYTQSLGGYLSDALSDTEPGPRVSKDYSANYSIPFGYWLLSANASSNRYQQTVAGINGSYLYSGQSKNQDLQLSYMLSRDSSSKTKTNLKLWSKQSKSYIDNVTIDAQHRRSAGWELGLQHQDYFGPTNADLSLSYRHGTGARGALQAPESNFGEGDSRPRILSANINLNTPFGLDTPWGEQKLSLSNSLRSQWDHTPLLPADRFSLGGRGSIRGYDGSMVIQAERGLLSRNELAIPIGASGNSAYLAYDWGHVRGPNAENMIVKNLQSAALGLRGQNTAGIKGLSYDLFMGWPISKITEFRSPNKAIGFNLNWGF